MSASINKVILVGNLGADPDQKVTSTGQTVTELRVATTEQWNDKQGVKQERTEWHRVIAWGKLAENCGKYLAKGRQVYVEGAIHTRTFVDKDGNTRYITEIKAFEVKFLGGGNEKAAAAEVPAVTPAAAVATVATEDPFGDLP